MVVIDTALSSAISLMVGGLFSFTYTKINHIKKENDALKAGMQSLLRDRIIQAYTHYVQTEGWIPIYAKESIMVCYESYEALGANGVIDDLIEQIKHLPNYPIKGDDTND